MQKLVQGVHHFQNIGFKQQQTLFERLKDSQKPEACMITCADSRIVPNLITHSDPGQLFIVRNVGNIIPCYGAVNNAAMAAVEYAVVELGIADIIICGHTCCGAMKALIHGVDPANADQLPLVSDWLMHAASTRQIIREHYGHLEGAAAVNAAAEENVLVQMEHLRTLPALASRLSAGRVRLHGWMYKIETGEVFQYDSSLGQFVKFGSDEESHYRPALAGYDGASHRR